MMMALDAVTKPAHGVITTRPPTMPEQKPSTVGLLRVPHSTAAQLKPPSAAASVVVVKATDAMPSEAAALPALKPYQPTQSMPVPTMVSTKLWGAKFSLPKPLRLPRITARTIADQPE